MRLFFRVCSVLLVTVGLLQAKPAQAQQAGKYMQLFYYGSQAALAGPVGRFSPALKGRSEIRLPNQDEYMNQLSSTATSPLSNGVIETSSMDSRGIVQTVNGKPVTAAEGEKYKKDREAREKAAREDYFNKLLKHSADVTNELSKALNEAAADGWEVTQMAALPNGGLVYLMRKAK
jgi:uncharacterized membrane-anchored protein